MKRVIGAIFISFFAHTALLANYRLEGDTAKQLYHLIPHRSSHVISPHFGNKKPLGEHYYCSQLLVWNYKEKQDIFEYLCLFHI